jgi:hypothetical protein
MTDQLSATDWLDQGLKTLAKSGFTALKADPLAKAMGHFADVGAFHAAVLAHWREIAAEQVIARIEQAAEGRNPLPWLLRGVFSFKPALEIAVRAWATHDATARKAVQAIDQRRLSYVENQLVAAGLSSERAEARAQILYWAFLGFALSDKPLSEARQAAVLDELVRIAELPG